MSEPEPLAGREHPSARRVATAVGQVLGGALLTVLVLLAAAVLVVPAITGAQTYTITGRSMEPALPLGSLIVTVPVDADEIRTGDIITFQLVSGQPAVATHRVVGFAFDGSAGSTESTESDGAASAGTRAFITAGDNNAGLIDAEPVSAAQLKGRLWYALPFVGWVGAFVGGEARAWIIPVTAVGLLAFGAWSILSGALTASRRRRGAP